MNLTTRFASTFCLTASFAVLSLGVMAAPAVMPDKNPNLAGLPQEVVSKPASAWLVGPSQVTTLDNKDAEPGCLMVTEFDNGIIIGLHARSEGIVGMTVDTHNPTLTPGDMHTVGVNVGQDAYVVNALASDVSTLSIDLNEAGGGKKMTERLAALGNFRLLIDEQPHYFATTGFNDGLSRLQACMGGMMTVSVPVTGPGDTAGKVIHEAGIENMEITSSGHQTPLALAMPNLVPTGYRFKLDNVDPMTEVNWQAGENWVEVMRNALAPHNLKMEIKGKVIHVTQRVDGLEPIVDMGDVATMAATPPQDFDLDHSAEPAEIPVGVWSAAKNEDLRDVLDVWGLMAGVNVQSDLDGDLSLPRDVRFEGRFDEAVQNLLALFSGKENRPVSSFRGMITDMPERVSKSAASSWHPSKKTVAKIAEGHNSKVMEQMAPIPDPPNAPKTLTKTTPKKVKTSGTWQALKGTTLRDTLEQWGSDAGVRIVWLTDQSFPLIKGVKKKGAFEDALMDVLSQFDGQAVRPTAHLNKDPNTGEWALIIKKRKL